ncbi:MAG: cytochrome c, partial [Gallionella sp.]
MKRGEQAVLAVIGIVLLAGVVRSRMIVPDVHDKDIPFYSSASPEIASKATDIIRNQNCKSCHSLWTLKDTTQSVPAPMLDGIGSL